MTLMELIAALGVAGSILMGAVALFNTASSSNTASTMSRNIVDIRTAAKQYYLGHGSYGTASLNAMLISAGKVPQDFRVSGSTITTQTGGTLTVTGNTTNFTIAITSVPRDICVQLLANLNAGWSSVKVGASTALTTFPVSPAIATAAAQCGGTAPFSITWTSTN